MIKYFTALVFTLITQNSYAKGQATDWQLSFQEAAYSASLEASASDPTAPDYIFEGPGELLVVKGDYGQVRWNRPVPDVWLRMDQLETCS